MRTKDQLQVQPQVQPRLQHPSCLEDGVRHHKVQQGSHRGRQDVQQWGEQLSLRQHLLQVSPQKQQQLGELVKLEDVHKHLK